MQIVASGKKQNKIKQKKKKKKKYNLSPICCLLI